MGQFASRAFDGDPYIDIMRALPDKELVWWVQKVIWLAEGFTLLEHFGRTYPDMFMHKCPACNGAGIVTCPHCNGYKVRRAHAHTFKLSNHTTVGRLLAAADLKECDACGGYCPWDQESEWQEEWTKWESRLAYYDRTYGQLMDEWYEDVINEGRMDEDTAPEEEPMPPADDQRLTAHISREVSKDKQRLKALMRRMGGHPYVHSHNLPYGIVDPALPLSENIQAIGYSRFDLPPELHPEKFPELLLEGPGGALQHFDRQIQAEYLIMNNLDAALRDAPKPAMFQPSAGTIACPSCRGQAWISSLGPSLSRLLKTEQPFWARTFAHMQPYWSQYSTVDGHPSYSPWMAALTGVQGVQEEAGAEAGALARASRLTELPTQPPVLTEREAARLEARMSPGPLPRPPDAVVDALGARRADGGVDFGALASALAPNLPSSPSYLQDYTRPVPDAADVEAAATALFPGARKPESVYGPRDPLSKDPREALSVEELQYQALRAPDGPLLRGTVLDAQLAAAELLNPAREAARKLRDARRQARAETPAESRAQQQVQPSLSKG